MAMKVLELPTNRWSLKGDPRCEPEAGGDEAEVLVAPRVHQLARLGIVKRVMMQEPEDDTERAERLRPGPVRAVVREEVSLRRRG
ncbi:MAG: hypothetical protein JNK72_04035 [Myxococcales bacterium]|nr:hypothetical protein [Myxococcales bacterium]